MTLRAQAERVKRLAIALEYARDPDDLDRILAGDEETIERTVGLYIGGTPRPPELSAVDQAKRNLGTPVYTEEELARLDRPKP